MEINTEKMVAVRVCRVDHKRGREFAVREFCVQTFLLCECLCDNLAIH